MTNHKKVNLLLKSSVIYVIATIIGQGMSFLGIIVFTRLMNQEDYGNYSTYYAYVSIFTVLIGANLHYALNNAYIDKKECIKQFRKSVLILSAIIMFALLVIAVFVGTFILNRFSVFIIIMAALHSYGFFVVNYRIYSANMENDYKCKQWLLILPNTLQLVFADLFIILLPNISFEARVIGSTLGVCSIAFVSFVKMMKCEGSCINAEYWKYALAIALPSIIMSISYMLMQQCDKVMITHICGAKDTAVYSVIYYLGYALIAVDQATAPVRQAWIYKKLDQNEVMEAKNIQKWYLVVMAVLATGILMVGPEIIKIIAPREYWQFEYIVPFVISACMMLLYRFFTEVILFYKRNSILSMCVLLCALINVGLNAIMIPRWGAVSACYTTVISYLLLFVLTGIISNKCVKCLYSLKYFAVFIVWISAMSAISYFVEESVISRYLTYGIALIVIIIYVLKKQGEWKSVLWEKK